MLQPEDLGKAVVDVLKNNSNYYTYDIMLRDAVISHILDHRIICIFSNKIIFRLL